MRYRLIYYYNGEHGSYWSTSYILCQKYGYDVEIWEYNDQGSHLLERSLQNEQ